MFLPGWRLTNKARYWGTAYCRRRGLGGAPAILERRKPLRQNIHSPRNQGTVKCYRASLHVVQVFAISAGRSTVAGALRRPIKVHLVVDCRALLHHNLFTRVGSAPSPCLATRMPHSLRVCSELTSHSIMRHRAQIDTTRLRVLPLRDDFQPGYLRRAPWLRARPPRA